VSGAAPEPAAETDVADFLVALGEAMVDAGDPVTHVRASLERVALALGTEGTEVVVLATALFVSVPASTSTHTAVASAGGRRLRLDQVDDLFRLVDDAEAGAVGALDGLARLQEVRDRPPPFSSAARVAGYAVLAFGIALILRGSWVDVGVATGLGLLVGLVEVAVRRFADSFAVFLPVAASFGVALTVFLLVDVLPELSVTTPLIAPLVIFLPGALLTTAVIELSTGQMISGAGRLSAGVMKLVLLAAGIVGAAAVTGVPTVSVTQLAAEPVPAWAPWVGVALFGAGVVVHDCARPRSAAWIVLVLYVAYAAQVLGGLVLGGVLSAFVGALAMTPVAVWVARHPSGPPALVSFMPAFWLLVPGALGLLGITKYLGEDRVYGAASLTTAGATMVAIALGVLLGLTIASAVADRAGSTPRRA
jgi:uncharacterized membrane protein YjjP (DUF1212 family)/uncharacterized membrane protein YjjB (DUF3815 family)